MIDKHHSFSSILKETINELIVIKSICHSLYLAAEYAYKHTKKFRFYLEFIKKTIGFLIALSVKSNIQNYMKS